MAKTDKRTLVHTLAVSNMDIQEMMAALHKTIQGFRDDGWHFASHMPVDWLLENGKSKQYILCTFCR